MKRKVVSHPEILNGKPHVVGTKITVSSIISKLAKGQSIKQISHSFPQLSEEDVVIAIKFAEDAVSKPFTDDK